MLPLALPHSSPSYSSPPDNDSSLSVPRRTYFPDSVSPSDSLDEEQLHSPLSPHPSNNNYHYANRRSVDASSEMYENNSHSNSSSYSPIPFSQNDNNTNTNNYSIVNASGPNYSHSHNHNRPSPPLSLTSRHSTNSSLPPPSYLSESPSPVDVQHPHHSLPHPLSAPHSQDHFPASSYQTHLPLQSQYRRTNGTLHLDKHSSAHLLDHRRMSEPALFGNSFATPSTDTAAGRYQQFQFAFNSSNSSRSSSLHRGMSTGSLRDLHHHHQFDYSPSRHNSTPHVSWKTEEQQHHLESFHDEPLSPLNPNFSGGTSSPTLGIPGIQYSPVAQDPYGPSPPGTGTSTSSNAPLAINLSRAIDPSSRVNSSRGPDRSERDSRNPNGTNSKTYSFVSLPGNAVKKRPRRRYDEIERLYQCSWPDCNKAYGTLNHLNAHVTMQKHGQKRSPNEFKELRKQWRKAKKESEEQSRPARRVYPPHDRLDYSHTHIHQTTQSPHGGNGAHAHQVGTLPSTVTGVPGIATDGRYSGMELPIEEIRYSVDERERYPLDNRDRYSHSDRERERDREGGAGRDPERESYLEGGVAISTGARQRYSNSWQSTRSMSHSYVQQEAPLTLSIPSSQTTQSLPNAPIGRLGADVAINRLPPDSTLLTPLPGYQPPSLLPPLDEQQGRGQVDQDPHGQSTLMYPPDGYNGIYNNDTKPGSDRRGEGYDL